MARSDTVSASEEKGSKTINKKQPTFTIDDLLAEITYEDAKEGITARELCEKKGVPKTRANLERMKVKMKDWVALGKWEYVGYTTRYCDVLGDNYRSKAYRPKEQGT